MTMAKALQSRFSHWGYFLVIGFFLFIGVASYVIASFYLPKTTQFSSKALSEGVIPPDDQRLSVPTGASLLKNGKGITNGAAVTDGNFQVEGYCSQKNLGAVRFDGSTTWYCGSKALVVSDFDAICRKTYSNQNAFVIRSATGPTTGYNWRCFAFATTASASPTSKPTGIACGELCGGQNNGKKLGINCTAGTICGNNANGGSSGNRCIPVNAPGYKTGGGICKNDPNPAVFCINKADGTPLKTAQEIATACAALTTSPTPAPTVTPTPVVCAPSQSGVSDLNKNCKADPDDYRLFLEDYRAHLGTQ